MKRLLLASLGLGFLFAATHAEAAHFTCPYVGGNFVFGQAANVNSLDQMASNTISTRNIAMNIYEALMTRSESDQPTSVQIANTQTSGWNFFFTGWGTEPALGPIATMQFFAQPVPAYYPPKGHPDPEVLKLWNALLDATTDAGRRDAFANMQRYVLDHVTVLPFGSLTPVQAVRSDVKGFVPYRIPRITNVWFQK